MASAFVRLSRALPVFGALSIALLAQTPADTVVEKARHAYLTNPAVKVKPAFLPLPAGAVQVDGWLKDWATTARNGITGHLDEYSKTYGEAWKGYGFEARGAEKDGTGWPLEQSSYWLDGAVRLAWILDDEVLKAKVRQRLDMVVNGVLNGGESFVYWRPKSVLNARFNSWAHSHMGRALVAYYQATADPRVLEALVRVYRDFTPPDTSYEGVIGAVNADPMIDTFVLSGDSSVLAHALGHTSTATYRDIRARWGKGDVTPGHGVIFYENLRLPALFYPWTGNRADLDATLGALDWHDRTQLLPIGVSSAEEYHAGIGGTRDVETCDVAASMWTYLSLLRITGDGDYSDRIEKVFFNAGPAPVDRDFKAMCYYQSPNRYSESNPGEEPENPGAQSHRFTRIGHEVLCCVGNLNRVIPNFAMHMWMATLDNGLAATLYGPSAVRATVAGGVQARIEEQTNYPFEETIRLRVTPSEPARFPLYLRIPGWCHQPEVRINGRVARLSVLRGRFLRIDRKWHANDQVVLRFPMQPVVAQGRETPYPQIPYFAGSRPLSRVKTIDGPWANVNYGPLLFALPIRDVTPNQAAPEAQFQFALDVTPERARREIRVVRTSMPETWEWGLESPLQLAVRVREFDWRPTELQPLPPKPVRGGAPREVLLVPYGCTKFRVSMFPVTEAAWQAGANSGSRRDQF